MVYTQNIHDGIIPANQPRLYYASIDYATVGVAVVAAVVAASASEAAGVVPSAAFSFSFSTEAILFASSCTSETCLDNSV